MQVKFNKKEFMENKIIQYKQNFNGKHFFMDIVLCSDKFVEYQKNLFSEFYTKIIETEWKHSNFLDFKKELESNIKKFNTQLRIFQEKIDIDTKIEIRWCLQVTWQENYLCALMWETSLIIFRNNKLESIISNEVDDEDKIDIFSEIIEWELEDSDKILWVACNVYNYLTDDEIKEVVNVSDTFLNVLEELLLTRINKEEIWFIFEINIVFDKIFIKQPKDKKISEYKFLLQKYRYSIIVSICLIIVIFILISIFSYLWANNKQIINVWEQKIIANIDNLKRKIDAFWKLENTSTDVARQQYDEIMKELDLYEKNNIQTLEIKELKKKMNQLYYKWFHINIVSETDWLLTDVYSFSDQDISELSWIIGIIKTSGYINVYGKKWVILWIVGNNLKWILQKLSLPSFIKSCSENLSQNGLYCILANNDIYNFSKYWVQALKNSDNEWFKDIISIWIYWVNKLYTLDNNFNIIRYVLKSKNSFTEGNKYIFTENVDKNIIEWVYSWTTFSIDWSFIVWTKSWLIQAYRKSLYDTYLYVRTIDGWEEWIIDKSNDLKWKVKVISYPNDNYIFLYDYNTQSIIVYLTSPYKTNTAYTTSYKLLYKYKIKFDLTNDKVKDVYIDYLSSSNKHYVYILTNKKIYKLDLQQFKE